jgi:hypothetical protein
MASAAGLPPIVFNLDGDGVELVDRGSSTVMFDADSDGVRQRTGWIGPDDGVLALDRNGDGQITTGSEISFIADTTNAKSDLEGLSAFDSNGNGALDRGDKGFRKFRIWRDANQDGVSQRSELRSLSGWGIASISLSPNATFDRDSSTDNSIVGITEFTRRNGSKGRAADVVLVFDASDPPASQPASDISRARLDTPAGEFSSAPDSFVQHAATEEAGGTAGNDQAPQMYGQAKVEEERVSAGLSVNESFERVSEAGVTSYGESIREAELAVDGASELVEIVRHAQSAAAAYSGWRTEWLDHLLSDTGAFSVSETPVPALAFESAGTLSRQVLQAISAMAAFNTLPAAEIASVEMRGPQFRLADLAVDLRAA